jgi:resuscitation-promoting factor RpfB
VLSPSKSSLRFAVPGVALAGVVATVAPTAATAAPTPAPVSAAVTPTASPTPSTSPTATPSASPSPSASSTADTVVVKTHHGHFFLRFHTTYVHTRRLYRGQHHLRRRGVYGRVDRWFHVTYVNGHYDHRKLVRWHRRHARNRVIAIGTRPRLDWRALAQCESGNRVHIADPPYYGLYQFDLPTWRSVGGHGRPSSASRAEQTHRAQILFNRRGRSPWPVCGSRL